MNIKITKGVVTKDGEEVGSINGDVCTLLKPIGPTVKAAINKEHGGKLTYALVSDKGTHEEPIQSFQPSEPLNVGDVLQDGKEQVQVLASHPQPLFGIDRLAVLIESGEIPQPPLTRPDMGDKTPEYVEWFREHATPEEFAKKYHADRKLCSHQEANAGAAKQRREIDLRSGFNTLTGDSINLNPIRV